MHLIFFDEAKNDTNYSHYHIGAVCIEEAQLGEVEGTDFAYGRQIQNLVDSVHFTHSHLSRFLQLADAYVWLLQFQNRNRGSENFRHQAMLKLLKKDCIDLSPSKYKEWPKS